MKKDRWDDYEAALEKANKTERARIMSRWKKDIEKDFTKVIKKGGKKGTGCVGEKPEEGSE
jgi:hypothetical protein